MIVLSGKVRNEDGERTGEVEKKWQQCNRLMVIGELLSILLRKNHNGTFCSQQFLFHYNLSAQKSVNGTKTCNGSQIECITAY